MNQPAWHQRAAMWANQRFAPWRYNFKWLLVILVFLQLISVSVLYAVTLSSVTPLWNNATGSSGAPTCLVSTSAGAEQQLRFGDNDFNAGCPADPSVQSGIGFEGSAGATFSSGQPFVLGELTHYNNPIFASSLLVAADLNLSIVLSDPATTQTLTTTITLDETANSLTTCPYGDTPPCADRLSLTRQTVPFTAGGQNYQLEILGLIPGQMGTCSYSESQINWSYISDENAANSACLFGRLTPVQDAELVIAKQASVAQASPGDLIDYQIDYNCFSTTTSCSGVVLTDYLPDGVVYVGSTGSTHTISSTGTYTDTNHTVRFQFIEPLPAGSTGFVRIRVRVRNDGTVANGANLHNLAVGSLSNGPTSDATNDIPVVASSSWDVIKTAPAVVYLDTEPPFTDNTYSVAICSNGSQLNLLGAQMVDTLPAGAVFVSASGGGVYNAGPPQTVTWNLGDLPASSGCTYRTVTVQYPNPPFVVAQNVTNTVNAAGTIVGDIPWTDTASVTNPLQLFTPDPRVQMSKSPGRSGYVVGARAEFLLAPRNTGNVNLDNFTVTDTLPAQLDLTQITVGSFDNYSGTIIVRYERSDNPGVWNVWPGGPFPDDNRTLNVSALGLPAGVWITRVQWDFGTVPPGFAPSGGGTGRIRLYGTILATDHNGDPVTDGSTITNTATLDWYFNPSSGGPGTGGSSTGSATIDVDAFPIPEFDKTSAGGVSAAYRFLIGQQVGYYILGFNNNTGITVDNFTISDTIPPQFNVTGITVGRYDNFSGTVTVRYQANGGGWTVWPGSPFAANNQTLTAAALGLPGGTYITAVQWDYGTVGADFRPRSGEAPRIYGAVMNPDRNGSAVNDGHTMTNHAALDWSYLGTADGVTDTQSDIVRTPVANPSVQKTTTTSGPYIPSSRVTYALRVGAASSSPSVLVNPIVMELLPVNLQYEEGTWAYNAGGSGVGAPAFERIDNYDGTGRTLLRWRFTGSFPQNQFATITFNTLITAGSPEGTLTNEYYVTSNDVIVNGTVVDTNDLDGDSSRSDTLVGTSTTIPVDQLVGLDSYKGVRGELDTSFSVYPNSGYTIPNGRVDYRLTIINRGNIPINNVKVVDILPFVGDTGVQDVRPRNSAWRPVLTAPVSAPANVTVYYSTSKNPCRPQIIPSGPAGCTAPNWSTLPPADISTVYSLRFDFAGTLLPGESFNFNWTMRAPADALDGTIAWNSFAYTSTNAFTGVPLRPAEPNKVGIEMQRPLVAPLIGLEKATNGFDADLPTGPYIPVGDLVTWTYVITNTGNTRLANITLADDRISPLACAEGPIPNLNAGAAFTCTVTGMAALGQYANLATVSGQPVDAADQPLLDIGGLPLPDVTDTDPSHYFGYNPTLSSLGNYVWIDSNNDGQQDAGEPGLPGVTVNLLDGAGNPMLDGLGNPITTMTDGNGLYLFTNLAAGTYSIGFVIPPTYAFTTPDVGADTTDSDANPATGRTISTVLGVGMQDLTSDAGVVPLASIGDFVWRDSNGNNMQDAGESGVAGVRVDLLNAVGGLITSTFTDADGLYRFTDLVPGEYAVQFTLPAGFLFSLQDQGDDTLDSDPDITSGRTANTTLMPGENDPTWDAGLVPVASIGDRVWRDMNNNGQQDAGEPGIANVTVNLLDSGGVVVATTTTDANGNYRFSNLRPATYAVEFVLPPTGYIFSPRDVGNNASDSDADTSTGRTITTVLSPGENDLTWDAGFVPLASIGDYVWRDMNNNGVQDDGATGLAGVTVRLLDSSGAVIKTTTTDANGNYLFDELIPGVYAIEVVRPAGYVFSPQDQGADASDSDVPRTFGSTITAAGRTINTTLSPGENDLTWDAGLVVDASIGNYVWYDLNDNGLQDDGATGVSGVTVRLLDGAGTVLDTTTTDGSGYYLFDFLIPGNYALEFVPPAGYTFARRDQGADASDSDPERFTGRTSTTTLAAGENDLDWDAGLVQVASIGDRVWIDLNNNGVQDGEAGYSGATVRLLDATLNVIRTTTTDANGYYLFDNLPSDTYSIEVLRPNSYVFSTPDQGGNDAADSDVSITTGRTIPTDLTPNEHDLTWAAGLVPPASSGDREWRDNNNNRVQDAGEPGVNNVTVRLLNSAGTVIATTTTNAAGNYSFTNLRPGDYSVQFVLRPGFQFSPQDAAAATDATDSDADITTGRTMTTTLDVGESDITWDAGFVPLASIGDYVWRDMNNNGVQDDGATGLAGVTVRLLNSSGAVIATTTTNAAGNYSFTNLPPGEYAIQVVLPVGYQFSPQDAAAATDATDSDVDTTTGRTVNTTLTPAENDTTWDAGVVPLASIGDRVWRDTNGNGQQDGGEPGVANVTVNLLNNVGTVIGTTTTNAAGNYSFTNLPPGSYAIAFELPGGYIFTARDQGADASDSDADRITGRTITTTLDPDENDLTWDAGIVEPASLGDFVWRDTNDDGIQNDGATGQAGVTVRLLDGAGNPVLDVSGTALTRMTDADGYYLFDNLIPGDYIVEFVVPAGYAIARLNQGGDDTLDSDADRTTGRTGVTTLTPGENDVTWDAGLVQLASIGNYVWRDMNNNGVQDATEAGVTGVTVNLLNAAGTVIDTTVTDADGLYRFDDLVPDVYAIEVILPAGYQFSPQDVGGNVGSADTTDSDVNIVTGRTVNTVLGSGEHDPTWDAGLVPLASIGDRVWSDTNDNGIQDDGATGVGGVTVHLLNSGGVVIATTTTNAAGNYNFINLPPGDYSLEFVAPAGYTIARLDQGGDDTLDSDADRTTGRTIPTTLEPDQHDMTWDAGLVPLASIGDYVWRDMDNDGVQEVTEAGLAGVTVRLLDSGGAIIGTDITDANGLYGFTNLVPDTYAIEFALPAGYQFSPQDAAAATEATDSDANTTVGPAFGRTVNVRLMPGDNDLTWDAGVVPLVSVGDLVWVDMDNDGVQDATEAGLAGVIVNLLDAAGQAVLDGMGAPVTRLTDANGNYLFDQLPPGSYMIEVVLPVGYQFSPQDAAAATDATDSDVNITTGRTVVITLNPADDDRTWDAGVVPLTSIGDVVWRDDNGDGVQDGGEPGVADVTVRLLNSAGVTLQTTTTDINGNYLFDQLPPGDYAIEVELPDGYIFSPQDVGGNIGLADTTDSDVDTTTGRTMVTTLDPDEADRTWDAGLTPLASIGDFVWRDDNADGVQDASEAGVNGVTVHLLDSGGNSLAVTTTDANGFYAFTDLVPGDYAIEVELPGGYIFSPQDAAAATDATDSDVDTATGRTITTTLTPGENDLTWDAGLIPLGSLGDLVWIDLNGNGVLDAAGGETGIPNVTIRLLDNLGNIIATTTTDADGYYHFIDLTANTYTVQVDVTTLPPLYGRAYDPDGVMDDQTTYTLGVGEQVDTLDFGYWPLGSIGNTVWLDLNGNGVLDSGEQGIPGVTVILIWSDGTHQTDVTDGDGHFLFTDLPPGIYIVVVDETTLPPGLWQSGDPDSVLDSRTRVDLGPGENRLTLRFGYAPVPVAGLAITVTPLPTPVPVTGEPPVGPASPAWTPVPACPRACVDWQLYHTNETGDWEIFRLGNLSDRPAVSPNLSQGEGYDDTAPTRSPNAEWIVFASNRDGNWELYAAPTDGDSSRTRRLTYNAVAIDTDPVWGPNNYVVFETNRDGNWELYLLDMIVGTTFRLTNNPANDVNAYWSPDGTKLLFQSDRSGLWQIYELDLRTGMVIRLSDSRADDVDPQYNQAGDHIVFRSYRDSAPDVAAAERRSVVYTMTAAGLEVRRVSDPAGDATNPVWSPDDRLIAYQSDLDGDLDIYVYAVGSGQTRQVTDNTIPDYAPTWQCGTTQVIFTSEITGNPDLFRVETLPIQAGAVKIEEVAEQLTLGQDDDIYPMNAPAEENASREGRLPGAERALGEQTLFLLPEFPVTAIDRSIEAGESWESINSCEKVCPAWSLYHSDRTGDWEIFRVEDDATDASSLNLSLGRGANDFGPTRAPNGQWVAFTSDRDGNEEIYIAAADGGSLGRATFHPARDTDPVWSPDSQRLVFESERDGNWNLYLLDVQTGLETRLTDDPAADRNASWSSAGGKIAFQSSRDGLWAIYVYDLATQAVTRLTALTQPATDPVFSNGGGQMAYRLEQADGRMVIAVMAEDGSREQIVSEPAAEAGNMAWYFDDTLLAYQSDRDGDPDIYVYDFASQRTRQLTGNEVPDYAPTWQCGLPAITFTSEVTGNADLFRVGALPIDADPVAVQTGAARLTANTATDRYPMGAPTNEDASRE